MTNHLFKNKYRKGSLRLQTWDYSWNGNYFITICVKDKRIPWFGKINNGFMTLNEIGCVVADEWQKTEKIRKDVKIGNWIVMPNHVHGIISIQRNYEGEVETPRRGVSTIDGRISSQWKPNSLGSIVNQIKSVCTKRIRNELGQIDFAWQPRFHEHIIRNEKSLQEIREYIQYNPLKWELDKENPNCKL